METCTRGLKRGASNSAETIPTNQPTGGNDDGAFEVALSFFHLILHFPGAFK